MVQREAFEVAINARVSLQSHLRELRTQIDSVIIAVCVRTGDCGREGRQVWS